MTRQINSRGLQLIEQFEGLRLNAYDDSTGVWTIGYGHTKDVHEGQTITREQAESFLRDDLQVAESAVESAVPDTLTNNQFAALVSFTFNLGAGNLHQLLKRGLALVPGRILLFDHAAGRVMSGLTRRRKAERELFLREDNDN
jgi:lysozyme